MEGRALRNGDMLPLKVNLQGHDGMLGRQILSQYRPSFPAEVEVRVILGPQEDYFTPDGITTFLSSAYEVTHKIDRMGYRLEGPTIAHRTGPDMISDGIPSGGLQVPGDGQPMILLVDDSPPEVIRRSLLSSALISVSWHRLSQGGESAFVQLV